MRDKYYQSTLALAGIIQAISLVREIAQTGKVNEEAFNTSIYSIFQTEPKNIIDVYGNIQGIKTGVEKLIQIFNTPSQNTRSLTHYLLSLLHLQKKISRSPKILNQLTQRLQQIKKQSEYFHLTHPTVVGNLADAYLNTISTFKFRIIIWGNQRSLTVNENMDKIRALLMAAIRSAFLWRQVGGSRLQLLFSRSKIKATAEKILAELTDLDVK